jgi:polyprenyl-phospho-N-acetylgalactosaminyl synthase
MNLLQIILSVAWFVFLLVTIDLYQRKKFTILHFLIFFFGSLFIVLFAFNHAFLDAFGNFFGIARWADLIVYIGIISLVYLYFDLLNQVHKRELETTALARSLTIKTAQGSISQKEIVLIIPCYWEDQTALHTVTAALDAWYGVICIDDGNNAVSFTWLIKQYASKHTFVLLTHPYNLWQGAALQTWSEYIQQHCPDCRYAVHFDADWQMQLSDIPVFLDAFNKNDDLDIALWSRYLWKQENIPLLRKMMKYCARLFMRYFVWLRLTDTHNWFRMIKASVLPSLQITLNRMAHASEIEYIIAEKKLTYTEVPVHILYTEYSLNKWQKITWLRKVFKDFVWKTLFYK